ncbi:hypothetical protein ACOT81_44735 [Streptomyces sp. WI04-05B]|jgi:DHA1 family inner membrane transport protein|uniref:hypothetical protein n=1 Tax=Streptomyces TaxID=1883 RepID=UPI0029B79E66|nr:MULTISPECIES: hypothetical protein [Streptomyces]MDX2548645.1 hypothetical protein [Streptomyces sp. WI04-05B]MDX2589034.1 hypothetical protein [Streptomyces sp. WI04-05A]MDX3746537.1 hypothetical protein [Streptomyces sp. AK08-02]
MTRTVAPAVTTVLLLALCLLSGHAAPTVALIALLGLFGLGANPVLIFLGVSFAGQALPLRSALTESPLRATGPAAVGTGIAALTLIPAITIALIQRRRPMARIQAATA